MINNTLKISAAIAATLVVAPTAYAHQYYNLTGTGTIASGDSAIGFGITNSINGTDGVSAGSNVATGSPVRISDGTTVYNATTNNFISGTGSAAPTANEIPGNLPYMWYSGQHTTATGVTKRAMFTGSSATDNTSNLLTGMAATAAANTSLTLPNGTVLTAPGTTNWGTNNTASLTNTYNAKNTGTNAATWGTIMADLPANDQPYQAVAGNSASTGLGLDYGLIHVSCGGNTASDNCATAGPVLTTITIANDADFSQNNGLLDVALYRNVDTSTTSDRNAAAVIGEDNIQGSSLGEAIWTASMSAATDLLSYSFIFDQAEWLATGTAGFHTNGFYTLVVGAHGGLATDGVVYQALVTTSPAAVPVPAAIWLFGSAMAGWLGIGRRKQQLAA